MAVSFQDLSPLPDHRLQSSNLDVRAVINMRNGGSRNIEFRGDNRPIKSSEYNGVWELNVDLKAELGLEENRRSREVLNDIYAMRVQIFFRDSQGGQAQADAFLTTHYSPLNRQIKVSSSTQHAKVKKNEFKFN